MKKKLLVFMFTMMTVTCFNSFKSIEIAKAEDTVIFPIINTETETGTDTGTETVAPTLNSISIKQYSAKTIYSKGENLDLSDMILEGYYSDGTIGIITDYTISGYNSSQLGNQIITISYQGFTANFSINVIPTKVTNITVSNVSTASYTLTWDWIPGVTSYEIYSFDPMSFSYVLITTTNLNSYIVNDLPATVRSYKICAVENVAGIDYRSEYSDTITGTTAPEAVTGLNVTGTTSKSISLSWNPVNATGYIVYRSLALKNDFKFYTITNNNSYTDKKLSSGTGYLYKVCAYSYDKTFSGGYSAVTDTSTNAAKVVLKYKAGEQKIRLEWAKVTGASYYDIYIQDEVSGFSLLTSRKASSARSIIVDELSTGSTYSLYAIARRSYNGVEYNSTNSDCIDVEIKKLEATSSTAKLFPEKEDFLNSWTFTQLSFFSKYVNYDKSYIIPGLVTTNVNGFSSTTMCPQGITFAGDYLLQTAYDISDEENSVIYVMDKTTKELLTTLILPSKTHAGGICFDGLNVWVPTGKRVSSIPFTDIEAAVANGQPYSLITYTTTCVLDNTVSFMTYYQEKLWVGTYNELEETYMYSYTIENKDTVPTLTQTDTIAMPTRVQGVAFTKKGTLILSRSCQLHKDLRGYMRQIDLYQPDFENVTDGIIELGELINTVEMPSMNEGIAINGSYLYVTYETAAFKDSAYKMDRICAFKLSSLLKKMD